MNYILEMIEERKTDVADVINFILKFKGYQESERDLLESKRKILIHSFIFELDGLCDSIERYTKEYNDREIYKMCREYLRSKRTDKNIFEQSKNSYRIIMNQDFFKENRMIFFKSHEYLRDHFNQEGRGIRKNEKIVAFEFFGE